MTKIPRGRNSAATIAAYVRSMDPAEPLVFTRHLGNDDVFRRGRALIVVPGIWTGMDPLLLTAMRARRACSTTGRCQLCGECASLAAGTFPHESWCPVPNDRLGAMVLAWERRVGRHARGCRIQEIPGQHP